MPEPQSASTLAARPYQLSFETEVFRRLERLTMSNEIISDSLEDLHDTVKEHGKDLTEIKSYMAVREAGECPIKHEMDRRLAPLETRQLLAKSTWRAVSAVSGGVALIVAILYHFLGTLKLFAGTLKP